MIDDHYVAEACRHSQVHAVTDSDELQMFELTAIERVIETPRQSGASAWEVALFAADCDALNFGTGGRVRSH